MSLHSQIPPNNDNNNNDNNDDDGNSYKSHDNDIRTILQHSN